MKAHFEALNEIIEASRCTRFCAKSKQCWFGFKTFCIVYFQLLKGNTGALLSQEMLARLVIRGKWGLCCEVFYRQK